MSAASIFARLPRRPGWAFRQGERPFPCSRRPGAPLQYGLRQETVLKSGLAREFEVIASADLDYLQKLDCIVRDKAHPELPAVGIQLTTKTRDIGKMLATLAALRSSRPVSRAVYLIAETVIAEPAFALIGQLVRRAAVLDREVMVVAHLARNRRGDCCLDVSRVFSLKTGEGTAAIH